MLAVNCQQTHREDKEQLQATLESVARWGLQSVLSRQISLEIERKPGVQDKRSLTLRSLRSAKSLEERVKRFMQLPDFVSFNHGDKEVKIDTILVFVQVKEENNNERPTIGIERSNESLDTRDLQVPDLKEVRENLTSKTKI